MSDVCERSAVYDRRGVLQSLYQVRFQGILQKCSHSTLRIQVTCGYRLLLGNLSVCISDNDAGQTLFQVFDIVCQTQNCHDLRCNCDVVTILSGHSVGLSAKTIHYETKLTVIHIHTSSPGDLSRVDVQLISLIDMVVDHGCQQVVGCSYGMEVTGEMKVDILHGNYLRVSAACCSALNAEYRSKGRLTEGYTYFFAQFAQSVCQTYGGSGLSFTCRCGVDGGNQNQFSIRFVSLLQHVVVDFSLVITVLLQIFCINASLCSDLGNRGHGSFLCDFNV